MFQNDTKDWQFDEKKYHAGIEYLFLIGSTLGYSYEAYSGLSKSLHSIESVKRNWLGSALEN